MKDEFIPSNLVWGLLLILLLMMVGCSEKSEDPVGVAAPPSSTAKPSQVSSEPTSSGKTKTVGVSLPERNPFYLTMQAAMETTAQANSLTLDIQFADGQPEKQAQQVEAFARNGVNAILLCPSDPQKSVAGISKANAARIPLFTVHLRSAQGTVEAHIGTDEARGGQMAAQRIAELLKDKGSVLLEEMPNDPDKDQAERAKGFEEEIARHPSLRLLHLWDLGKPEVKKSNPAYNAVFYVNDERASLLVNTDVNRIGEAPLIVGYGGNTNARDLIRRGQNNYMADVCPDPMQLGASAMDTIARSLRGEKIEPFVKVSPEVIDASNLDKP